MSAESTNIGKSRNENTAPVIHDLVELNKNTSTTILTLTKFDSTIIFSNTGNQDAYIKLQPAATDDDLKGFVIYSGTTTDFDLNRINYPGEISGITMNGKTDIYCTVL